MLVDLLHCLTVVLVVAAVLDGPSPRTLQISVEKIFPRWLVTQKHKTHSCNTTNQLSCNSQMNITFSVCIYSRCLMWTSPITPRMERTVLRLKQPLPLMQNLSLWIRLKVAAVHWVTGCGQRRHCCRRHRSMPAAISRPQMTPIKREGNLKGTNQSHPKKKTLMGCYGALNCWFIERCWW